MHAKFCCLQTVNSCKVILLQTLNPPPKNLCKINSKKLQNCSCTKRIQYVRKLQMHIQIITGKYHSKRLDYDTNSPRIFWCNAHEIFTKNNSPRVFWCNDYVISWEVRQEMQIRQITRNNSVRFFDVNQDEIITRNNSLKIKWWNVILEFPMV